MSACATTGASTTRRPDSGALEALLVPWFEPGCPIAVAYSGGRDSAALLHAACAVARARGVPLHALHVHHGLSVHADQWCALARSQCERWGVGFHAVKVRVTGSTGEGVEAEARRLRYEALARMAREADCSRVLLAHHADDQAETLLLQALRGTGLAGVAAMPLRLSRDGIDWLRPWLRVRRERLALHVLDHEVPFVEDASNADERHARNRLRHGVLPGLEAAFPGAVEALGEVASNAQEALECLRDLAEQDLGVLRVAGAAGGMGLDVTRWYALSSARRSLALRTWLAAELRVPAPRTLVQRLLRELHPDGPCSRWPAPGGRFLACYRNVLQCGPVHVMVDGEAAEHAVLTSAPNGAGTVVMVPSPVGVPKTGLASLNWRARAGGEQFQLHRGGVPRSLKKCFQTAGVPAWLREVPLLYAGDRLLFVPALGVDARYLQDEGAALVALRWRPGQPG